MKKMIGLAVAIMSIMYACQAKANDPAKATDPTKANDSTKATDPTKAKDPDSEWKLKCDEFYQAMNDRRFRDARLMILKDQRFVYKPLADSPGALTIHMAASYADKSMVVLLLQKGVNVNVHDKFSATPLAYAIRSHAKAQREVVLFLISKGADLATKDNDGLTLLHYAVIENNEAMINLLLLKKVDINSKDIDGKTPLHYAATAYRPSKRICQLLLSKGADPHAKDKNGDTPAFLAKVMHNNILLDLLK